MILLIQLYPFWFALRLCIIDFLSNLKMRASNLFCTSSTVQRNISLKTFSRGTRETGASLYVIDFWLLLLHCCVFSVFLQQDCPNGKLTPAKFVDMYKMFFPSGNAEEFCDHVFRTFDMDKNGYIDFKVSESF